MSTDNLNFMGKFVLAGAASIAVNAISHPLGTIETCMQAREPIPWLVVQRQLNIPLLGIRRQLEHPVKVPLMGLYRGYGAICCVETVSFALAYVTKDALNSHLGPIGAIFAAAAISTPVMGVGEGAMKNRQANNLSYRDRELWKRSFRVSGLIMTLKREIFWNLGILYAAPKMSDEFSRRYPDINPLAGAAVSGLINGVVIGFITTPIAGIKTVIQASKEDLTILQAVRKITASQPNALMKTKLLFAGATSRVGYLGLAMSMINVVYQLLPGHLPDVLKRQQ